MRVLVVDDTEIIRSLLTDVLGELQMDVDACASLQDARQFDPCAYDWIILDECFPDGSGLEFLQELRARNCPTPVIILSTCANDGDYRRQALEAGAAHALAKPVPMARFCSYLLDGSQQSTPG